MRKTKISKDGEAPICMRISVNKQWFEVMIKRTIPIDLWNQSKECSKGKDRTAKELNQYSDTLRAKFFKIQKKLEIENIPVTIQNVKERFYGKVGYSDKIGPHIPVQSGPPEIKLEGYLFPAGFKVAA